MLLLVAAMSAALAPACGASISISGTVKDADGKAVAGVNVYSVADPKVKTTSADDGSFTLSGNIADAALQPAATTQSQPASKPAAAPKAVTRTPVAAAKDGFMTAQVLPPALSAKDVQIELYPAIVGTKITLKGNRMSQTHMREAVQWDNSKEEKQTIPGFMFMIAFDGPPGIKAEADQIWADYHPGPSLDADAAIELENQFKNRLLFYIDGPLVDAKSLRQEEWGPGRLMTVTGTISEKDGKKYVTAEEWGGSYGGPKYPERILGPEKPLVQLPVKPGLTIKLSDKLTDALIYVPPGKFYMGNALEQMTHWQEAPQHLVTLTKGFYMMDHPITNAEYAAVTGDTTRNPKGYPDDAAVNMSCAMFDAYVKALEKLNPGKTIRCPTKSEWEYVARSGTSNIEFKVNNGRCGENGDRKTPVKTPKPNGWGFYGIIFSDGSERSCDIAYFGDHKFLPAETDPRYPLPQCKPPFAKDHIHACGGVDDFPVNELINDNMNVGRDLGGEQRNRWLHIRQRIVMEE